MDYPLTRNIACCASQCSDLPALGEVRDGTIFQVPAFVGRLVGGCLRKNGRGWGVFLQVRQTRQRREAEPDGQGGEDDAPRRPFQRAHGQGRRNRTIHEVHDRCDPDRAQLRPSRGAYPRATLPHQCLLRPRMIVQGGQELLPVHLDIIEQTGYRVKLARVKGFRLGRIPPINRRPLTSPNAGRSTALSSDSCEETAGGGPKSRARQLRKHATPPEHLLWYALRCLKPLGLHFRRQPSIGPYFPDFACHRSKLVVELDGSQHSVGEAHDAKRTMYLNSRGYQVLRFWNGDVLKNRDGVVEIILDAARKPPTRNIAHFARNVPTSPRWGR
jgi:very-short-patch-repair endonuclease